MRKKILLVILALGMVAYTFAAMIRKQHVDILAAAQARPCDCKAYCRNSFRPA